jgi:hypothetical protein
MITLLKAVSNSDTTFSVSSDASLPASNGVLLIGTEQITYAENYLGTLYGVIRGVNSTSAASHASGDAVTVVSYYLAGGVTSVHADSSSNLTGAVRLVSGSNVTLTQSGQDIMVAASGGAALARPVEAIIAGPFAASNNTFVDTPLTAAITLSSASNRCKITCMFFVQVHADDTGYHTIKRNSTAIGGSVGLMAGGAHTDGEMRTLVYIDTPGIAACTYTLQQKSASGQSLQTGLAAKT